MNLPDVKTLILCATLINFYMCGGLYVYGKGQKTYPGFRYWLTATAMVAIMYVLLFLRGVAPDWLTIVGANTFVFISAVLRIEGMKRFAGKQGKFNHWNFWMPALIFVWYSYFTFVYNSIAIRNAMFSLLTIVIIAQISRLLLSNPWDKPKRIAYFFIGALVVYGFFLIVRAFSLFAQPVSQSMTANTPFNSAYFLVVLISDISFSVCFILLNAQRTTVEVEQLTGELLQAAAVRQSAEEDLHQKRLQMIAMEERERMGRDLHDGLGQAVSLLSMQAQTVDALINEQKLNEARGVIQQMAGTAKDASADIRSYILGLRADHATQSDLYSALQSALKEFENAWGIETRFSPPPGNTPALTDMVKDQLLRIVQEALSNIHRHAQAKRVEILITSVEDALTLIVSDDGCGFDPLNIVADGTNHFGLTIMRERAELIGGKVEIRSAAGQGAQILIYVPYALSNSRAEETAELHGLRVLLVDDHPLLLEGMRSLLTSRGIHVIGTANDGLQARELARILHPDLIVMDIEMPNCNGIEATQAIKTDFPEMKIVIMTVSDDDEHLIEAIKNGAAGYMLKGMDTKAIFPLLAEVMRGETAIAQNLAARVLKDIVHDRKISQPAGLTARQWDVLRMVAGGLTYKEVGSKLSLSERAVKYHMGQILERLQVNSRDEAILYARKFTEKDK